MFLSLMFEIVFNRADSDEMTQFATSSRSLYRQCARSPGYNLITHRSTTCLMKVQFSRDEFNIMGEHMNDDKNCSIHL